MKHQRRSLLTTAVIGLFLAIAMTACGGGGEELTPEEVVSSFEAAGLEVGDYQPIEDDGYGLLPVVPDEGIRFYIPSLGEFSGGRVMRFEKENELNAAKAFYDTLGESPLYDSWTFVRGNILVQINGPLEEDALTKYEAALSSAGE